MPRGTDAIAIHSLAAGDALWESLAAYAEHCSWSAGGNLAKQMRAHGFHDWERVFAATQGTEIAGYCTLSARDCLPDVPYTPYISFVFVGEAHRGHRLSEALIRHALQYARELGFDRVYLVSDHVNLYEKYGFVKIDEQPAPWNPDTMETIFMRTTQEEGC